MDYNNEIYNLLRYYGKLRPESTFYHPMQVVLRNLSSIGTMSIYDLADASFVSTASISRMCRELGYNNYQSFKIGIYSAYRRAIDSEASNQVFRAPRTDTAFENAAMALNYLDQCRAGLDFSEGLVRGEAFQQHLTLIREAENVFVISTTYQEVVPLQNKLILSGKYLSMYYGAVSETVARCRKDISGEINSCCLFFLHNQEEYDAYRPFMTWLRKEGAAIILLRPMSTKSATDLPPPDLEVPYPDVGSISDDIFFSSYIACLTISL